MPRTCRKSSTATEFPGALSRLALAAALTLAVGSGTAAEAADSVHSSIAVRAVVSSRTSLSVSSDLLQFDVVNPGQAATASVEFSASARTRSGSEVMLSVEVPGAAEWLEGRDMDERALSFAGDGEGTSASDMRVPGPKVAGRWSGSGQRRGRLVFELRASQSGTYRIPVRFVLSAP